MTNPTEAPHRRSMRRIMLGGAFALVVVYVAGAAVQVPRTQADLSSRVERALADDGMAVHAEFAGQDGVLHCTQALADPALAVQRASAVWGVRVVETDASCVTTETPATTVPATGPATTVTTPDTTTPATIVPTTTVPTATTTAPATTAAVVEPAAVFGVRSTDGRLVLDGSLHSDLERLAVVQRAVDAVGPFNVVDELAVDAQVPGIPETQFLGVLTLVGLMPVELVTGELSWNGSETTVSGTYADESRRASFTAAADAAGAAVALTARSMATAAQGASLEAELNDLVGAEPILFDKGSTTISASSLGTVQRVAGIAKRYAGLAIEVQGHTDGEGDPGRNLVLSEQRAVAVLAALVERGVPAADLTATGFGMTQLVTDADGNELPDKSRRVVFGVTVAAT